MMGIDLNPLLCRSVILDKVMQFDSFVIFVVLVCNYFTTDFQILNLRIILFKCPLWRSKRDCLVNVYFMLNCKRSEISC